MEYTKAVRAKERVEIDWLTWTGAAGVGGDNYGRGACTYCRNA